MTYNPLELESVVGFLNQVNKTVYGIAPFTVKLPVKHLSSDYEDELIINATEWCDIGSHKVPEWNMVNTLGDTSVCEGCYDHFN